MTQTHTHTHARTNNNKSSTAVYVQCTLSCVTEARLLPGNVCVCVVQMTSEAIGWLVWLCLVGYRLVGYSLRVGSAQLASRCQNEIERAPRKRDEEAAQYKDDARKSGFFFSSSFLPFFRGGRGVLRCG